MPNYYVSKAIRKQVELRANRRCEYCQSPRSFSLHTFNIDHVIPLVLDGLSVLENLAYACGGCNNNKATRVDGIDPLTNNTEPLFHPRKQKWEDHFQWNEDHTLIIGKSPTDRATVAALKLNREGLPNLRRILKMAGEHPPDVCPK